MSGEQMEKMFDLFYSTRKGGTGLGLAVVQRIAKAHGAELDVVSSPEIGTTVRVLLPLAGSKAAQTGLSSSPRHSTADVRGY